MYQEALHRDDMEINGLGEFSRYRDIQNDPEIIALGLQGPIGNLELFYWPIRIACFKVRMDDYEEIERLRERLRLAEDVFNDFHRLICSKGCSERLLNLFENAYIVGFRNMKRRLYPDSEQTEVQTEQKVVSLTPIETPVLAEKEIGFIKRNKVLIAIAAAIVIAGGSFALHSRNDLESLKQITNAISANQKPGQSKKE